MEISRSSTYNQLTQLNIPGYIISIFQDIRLKIVNEYVVNYILEDHNNSEARVPDSYLKNINFTRMYQQEIISYIKQHFNTRDIEKLLKTYPELIGIF